MVKRIEVQEQFKKTTQALLTNSEDYEKEMTLLSSMFREYSGESDEEVTDNSTGL